MQFLTFERPINGANKRINNPKIRRPKCLVEREKDLWHPYELQSLRTDRFVNVVNQIIKGSMSMLPVSKIN
jgi:hypothetical protein